MAKASRSLPERNDQAILYLLGAWSSFARDMFVDFLIDAEEAEIMDGAIPVPSDCLTRENIDELRPGWEDDIAVTIVIEQPRAPRWRRRLGNRSGLASP